MSYLSKKYNIEKKYVQNEFEKLKNIKNDHNNIILNAAAFQQEMLKDLGIGMRYKNKYKPQKVKNETTYEYKNNIQTLLPQITKLKKNNDSNLIKRQKNFLDNLSLAEKIGIKKLEKMPLSVTQWQQIEALSLKREDYKTNCPICLDSLSKRETVLLSCTHIFHRVFSNINI